MALAECSKVDEAKEWSDRAAAIATYARQSEDNALLNLATKIKVRAVRRCGELLKEFQTGPEGGRPPKNRGGEPPPFLNVRQQKMQGCPQTRRKSLFVSPMSPRRSSRKRWRAKIRPPSLSLPVVVIQSQIAAELKKKEERYTDFARRSRDPLGGI